MCVTRLLNVEQFSLLNVEQFSFLAEAKVLTADWRQAYNAEHPHSALGMTSPARFAATWTASTA